MHTQNTSISTPCFCGSEVTFSSCCQPLIQGKKVPSTAEELLRSRYSAFTQGEVDYIIQTNHSKTRDQLNRKEIEEWSKNSEWMGLSIVQKEAGLAGDQTGTIVFCAKYSTDGKTEEHWEQSFFEKENGEWRFLDAKGVHTGTYKRTEPKIGRNDPCACGSGKKFKKCCGK